MLGQLSGEMLVKSAESEADIDKIRGNLKIYGEISENVWEIFMKNWNKREKVTFRECYRLKSG